MPHNYIVEYVDIKSIKPYNKNPRKNDDAVTATAESIKQFGWQQAIVVDENNVIICGHTRWKAAKKLGYKEIPVKVAKGLTQEQVRAYRLADNKTGEIAEWDLSLLDTELSGVADIDMSLFGFELLDKDKGETADDDVPEVKEEEQAVCKLGEVWQLGEHRLICGDSTDKEIVAKLMNGDKADMVLCDPPYGMHLDTDFSNIRGSLKSIGRHNRTRGNKYGKVIGDNEDFKQNLIATIFDNFNYCNEIFLFGADYFAEILQNKNDGSWLVWDKRKESQADAIGSEFELIWSKSKHKRRVLRFDWFGFISSQDSKDARNRLHPTQKPVSLLCEIINQWGKSCVNIVDLYGGSGSTLIACEQLNRRCYMSELSPHYCDVIIKRWETLTGKKAVRLVG